MSIKHTNLIIFGINPKRKFCYTKSNFLRTEESTGKSCIPFPARFEVLSSPDRNGYGRISEQLISLFSMQRYNFFSLCRYEWATKFHGYGENSGWDVLYQGSIGDFRSFTPPPAPPMVTGFVYGDKRDMRRRSVIYAPSGTIGEHISMQMSRYARPPIGIRLQCHH